MKFNGLTDKEVEESRKKNGSNEIPDSDRPRSGRSLKKHSAIR